MVLDQARVVTLAAEILGEDPEALEDLEPGKDGRFIKGYESVR